MKHLTGIRRFLLLGVLYSIGLSFSLYLAYLIRFDFNINKVYLQEYFANLIWVLPVKLTFLTIFGQFQGMLSFFSIPDLRRLTFACVAASIFIYIIWILTAALSAPPRGVLLADFTITLMGLSATRIALRQFRNSIKNFSKRALPLKPVAIVGAGDVGATLVKELLTKTNLGLLPVAYFDDNQNKKNFSIHGVPVLGIPELIPQFAEELRIQEAIIAMPSASVKRLSQIVKLLQEAGLKFETVPSLNQLATGRVKVSNIRPVEIQDLLGREAIRLESQTIQHLVNGKVTLVSGAGGSIGSELCRQIKKFKPSKLILLDRSEVQIFLIEQELKHMKQDQCIIPIVCDILDENRIKSVLNRFKPKIVFHAAAHKHVSLMEEQPGEAIKNNACGTARFANAALDAAVDRFILISTDKAINPTSVMGASKRLAEMYLQALNNENNDRTRFMAVRFGNVLDSSGSVIPIFKEQIKQGGPVTVTHPNVTRYFMTIPEAVGLVLQSATQGSGGEIYVLDMGKPIKILDLACQLIELSGFKAEEDIEIKFIGLRPGEKMYEEISLAGENMMTTEHAKIVRLISDPVSLKKIKSQLAEIEKIIDIADPSEIKQKMKKIIPEYKPALSPEP